ncbi:uncharacterized protein [Macrobrachium rosenbergii]|uniref:uncharacterized protein n=1 Tax=Macrobrachium rosenbergii TaxID=79674 RepID=UPI0034D5287F
MVDWHSKEKHSSSAFIITICFFLPLWLCTYKASQAKNKKQTAATDYQFHRTSRNSPPGKPGVDYPALKFLPETSFKCEGRALGYYADMETRCQVFHVCEPGNAQHDFLCPEGTIFNQKYIVCDWWYNVDCPRSPEFFELNEDFFKDGKVTSPPLPSTSVVIPSSFGSASQPSQQQQQEQHQRRKQRRRKQRPKQQLQAVISSSPITEVPLIAASTQRSPQAKVYVAPEQPNANQVSKPAAERTYIPPLPPNSEQSSRAERLRASRGPSGVPEVNERLSVPQALYQAPVVSEASAGNREAVTNSVGLSYNAPPRVSTSTDAPGDSSNGQRKQRISSQRRKTRNRNRIRSRTKPLGQGLAVEVQYKIGNDGMRFPDDAASRLTDSQPDDPQLLWVLLALVQINNLLNLLHLHLHPPLLLQLLLLHQLYLTPLPVSSTT